MSISETGLDSKLSSISFQFSVSSSHPYIRLANALPWREAFVIVKADLQKTKKGSWWVGRQLHIRVHLAVYILQCLLKATDRGIEQMINDSPVFQVFCGRSLISDWRCPDHTKMEEFRSRLSTETKKNLGDMILKVAVNLGLADPSWMDVDSTVQEANMAYPSDANLLKKLALKVSKVISYLKDKSKSYLPADLSIDIKGICKKAQDYFFLSKNTDIEKKRAIFNDYFHFVKHQLKDAIGFIEKMNPQQRVHLPWNIAAACKFIKADAWQYLLDVAHFTRNHSVRKTKRLCFHLMAAVCISKGKLDKKHEFGRQVQIGRIGGNFLIPLSTEIKMEDKKSLVPMVENHIQVFGQDVLKEVGTDKGYHSSKQIKDVSAMGINTDGVQRPANIKKKPPKDITDPLRDRRAGIEPLIGHLKSFGLRKSKMKSDAATHASVYSCTMGFNLHQIVRNLKTQNLKSCY